MATIVRGSILAAAAKCASDDRNRPQLNGVWVRGDGYVCATNGHVLFSSEPCDKSCGAFEEYPTPRIGCLGEAFNGEGIIMPAAAAIAAAKSARNKSQHEALRDRVVIVKRGEYGEAFSTDLDSDKREGFRSIEGPYPSVEQVIPKQAPSLRIAFDLGTMLQVLEAFKAAGVKPHGPGQLVFEFTDPLKAAKITASTPDGQALMALLMPLRLPE